MDTTRMMYTINHETGRKIKIGTLNWKPLAAKYYMINGAFTDQVIPDSRSLKVKEGKARKWVIYPAGIKRYIIVGSKAWNERCLEYEWKGREFGEKRKQSLPEFMNMVEKNQEVQRNKVFAMFDLKVAEGHLLDVIQPSLGYILTYYHTIDGNMYKEWMNEKRTKKDFHIHKDDDEGKIWVRLPDGKNEEEVEPLNLMIDVTGEFNEVAKKYILNGMRDYPQCFITIMAYNLIWT